VKAHHERDAELGLTGEHRLGDLGQIVLACAFLGVWIADTFFFKYTTVLNQYLPLPPRVAVAATIFAISWYLARKGLRIVFGEARDTPGVIRESVFGVVRHPIYLSEILLYLGFLVLSISLAAAVVWLAAIGFLHYISIHEERLLLARFGKEYEDYTREVPMWLPLPRSKAGR
jgi:protein-S-isoprenylcysteine O-methyltransferase Ste14